MIPSVGLRGKLILRESTMMESNTRTLKRYANRKLYDTHISAYVTLEEMAQVVREGNDVRVIDNTTKEDITYKTFIQLLHELERKSVGSGDVSLLNKVIRSSTGTFTGYINQLEDDLAGSDISLEMPAAAMSVAQDAAQSVTLQ